MQNAVAIFLRILGCLSNGLKVLIYKLQGREFIVWNHLIKYVKN